jgi:hypothetical protein
MHNNAEGNEKLNNIDIQLQQEKQQTKNIHWFPTTKQEK